ncbi:MAG TPA: NADPH-dependent FMN reductase [Flavitalea sp.]|nr:NADPH-dependent FMN reductase [Flavitalea sp.]
MEKKKVLAISGSTRARSTNRQYIMALAEIVKATMNIELYEELAMLPAFNPDLDNESVSMVVTNLRNKIRNCDGVLICTPEYAMGIPGSLKNAIDWTVSSGEFSHKPVALITASTSGSKGHKALIDVLNVIEAIPATEEQLLIPFAKTKIDEDNKIKDPTTFEQLRDLANHFYSRMTEART